MPISASVIFDFTSSTSAKHSPLKTFFIQGNKQKKSRLGRDQVNREGGAQGHAIFGQKLLNTQLGVGRCTHKSPVVKWVNVLNESSEQIH